MPCRHVYRQGRKCGTRGEQLGATAIGQDRDDSGMVYSDSSGDGKVVASDSRYILKLS